ncbi:hypothetical protein TNCV_2493091 [Trichonephila clavipes]|uniref:Uncharacterized protein n=1 Tax=Trichonephila clavipes TaxID=2585209 RepID=A0A8X6RQH9_TRICX|nr:hypothetical protein TNCV_2493091 [Trichonephila clavipes]
MAPMIETESVPEPDEISNIIEEVVELGRQINLDMDSDNVQEQLDFHNQGLEIDDFIEMPEYDIEELVSLDQGCQTQKLIRAKQKKSLT